MNLFGGLAGAAARNIFDGGSSKRMGGTSLTGNGGMNNMSTPNNMPAPNNVASPSGIAGSMNNATGYYNENIPKGYRAGRLQQFTPEQIELFQNLFGQLGPDSYLSQLAGGDESFFDQLEAPALRQFSSGLGGLASRFSQGGGGPGALSSRRSSGFQNASTAAVSNFSQDLQAQRQALQRQALYDLMGLSGKLLEQRPHEAFLTKKAPSESSGWGGLIGAGIGGTGGAFLGGPAGALAGAQLGYGVGSAF